MLSLPIVRLADRDVARVAFHGAHRPAFANYIYDCLGVIDDETGKRVDAPFK